MAHHDISRRGFFGHVAGAYTAIAMGAGATAVIIHDPMLDLIQRYRVALDYFNNNASGDDEDWDEMADATFGPLYEQLRDSPPTITTEEGAIEALRAVMDEKIGRDPFDESLVAAALAYFDQRAA